MRLPSIPTSTITTITTTTAATLLLSLLTLHGALAARARPKDAVLLSEVQALTLHEPDKMTTSRRTPPIPQLRCVSPAALCRLAGPVRTMRCTNQGAGAGYGGAEDVAWACSVAGGAGGGLPRAVRLDRTDVLCEGYASPDDPYVLRGSCGVEYTVRLTEEGRRRFPELVGVDDGQEGGGGGGGGGPAGEKAAWLFWLLFFAVLAWIAYGAWTRRGTPGPRPSGGTNRRGWGGGGSSGGWGPGFGPGPGGEDDPPPPYPGFGPKPSSSTESAWRPGFWSGLASGAAAGYMAANRGQRSHDRNRGRGRRGGLWRDNDGPGGWWSGSGSGSAPGPGSDSGLGSAWGARRSSSSGSGSRHESTGYGSTIRR